MNTVFIDLTNKSEWWLKFKFKTIAYQCIMDQSHQTVFKYQPKEEMKFGEDF